MARRRACGDPQTSGVELGCVLSWNLGSQHAQCPVSTWTALDLRAGCPKWARGTLAGKLDWEIPSFSCWTFQIPAVPRFSPLKSHLSERVSSKQSGLPI